MKRTSSDEPAIVIEKKNVTATKTNWSSLPPLVIERIVTHAVSGKRKETELGEMNWFALRVYKYGCVCTAWREAIRFSKTIFKVNVDDEEQMASRTFHIMYQFNVSNKMVLNSKHRSFIKNGYLQAVQSLSIEGHSDDNDLQLINDALKTRNSIVHLNITVCSYPYRQLINLTKQLTKVRTLRVYTCVRKQAEAEHTWELMCSAVHSNSTPKTIHFEMSDDGIIWSFLNEKERLKVGSIEKLVCSSLSVGFFANLAPIDTLHVAFDCGFRDYGNRGFLTRTKAKHLTLSLTQISLGHVDMLRNDHFRKTFTVETLQCVVGVQRSPIWANDRVDVWQELEDWLMPIFEHYLQQDVFRFW